MPPLGSQRRQHNFDQTLKFAERKLSPQTFCVSLQTVRHNTATTQQNLALASASRESGPDGGRDGSVGESETKLSTLQREGNDWEMELRMVRPGTDTGREVFIAERRLFCDRRVGKGRCWRRKNGVGARTNWGISKSQWKETRSEALHYNDGTLKVDLDLRGNWEKYWKRRRRCGRVKSAGRKRVKTSQCSGPTCAAADVLWEAESWET